MDIAHQISLIEGAARDYQDGLMPLQMLVHRVEGILAILDGHAVEDEIGDALFALEDVNAHTYMPDYDFATKGRSIVDRAVEEIIAKTQKYLPRSEE
jgi:hypothetical protein